MTIILRKFDMNYIGYSSFILMLGISNTGKSTITKDILYYYKDIPIGAVISKSKNKNIYKYIPPIFIHDNYNQKFIKNIINKKQLLNNEYLNYDNRSFLIFDQCLNEKILKKDKNFKKISKSYEELNLLYIIELNYIEHITEYLKYKVDYFFILKENLQINRKNIYDIFKKYLDIEFSLFCKFLDDYTHNYHFLILYLKSNSKYIEDKLFWYKSDIHNTFKICCDDAWNYNDENLIKEDYIDTNKKILNHQLFK